MKAIAVTLAVVLEIVRAVGPAGPCDGVVAVAIHRQANAEPIWEEREDGIERTVTILASLAMHEGRKDPNAIGDQGRSHGLYGIMTPVWGWPRSTLTDPETSTFLATYLVRDSFYRCAHRAWSERLAWYASSSGCVEVHPTVLAQSRDRVRLADEMMRRFFPAHAAMPPPGQPSRVRLP